MGKGAAFLVALFGLATAGCVASAASAVAPVTAIAPPLAREEAVTLVTTTGTLHGTLKLPAAPGPVPVALIIAGSGPTNRDGNSELLPGPSNYLRMLADALADRGIASLRYDKRGIAASVGALKSEEDILFDHYIEDATAWIRKLRADSRFSTVTVIGHSEGSLIGMVAGRTAAADAFVSIAGAGRKPQDIILEQIARQLPDTFVTQARTLMRRIEAGERPDTMLMPLRGLFRRSVQPYLVSWFRYDPRIEISRLTVPVLIIQGSTDLQISEKDASALLNAASKARLVVVPGMNHVLKDAKGNLGEQLSSYSNPGLPIVPQLVQEIAPFIRQAGRTTSSNARPAQHHKEALFGADKVKHFFVVGFVECLAFGGAQALGASRTGALRSGLVISTAVSLGREAHDLRASGRFSTADLLWDALGAGAAFLVVNNTQK